MSHPAGCTGVQRNITRRRLRQSRRVLLQGLAAGGGKPIEQMSPREARAVLADLQSSVKVDLPKADVAELIPAKVDRDWALVDALRRRESTAAERLLETFGDRVYRLALRITGNAQDAEEVVQDAFWNVVRHIDTFRGESLLGSWIYRITANAAYRKLRRATHRRDTTSLGQVLPIVDDSHGDWSAQIDDPAIQSELRDVLASAIDELPANGRAVFVLHDVEGLSMAEVADALGISLATAKTRAHRARLRLRRCLGMFLSHTTSSVDVPS
jgi:RNA polymerase sigma-70 factor (ECF subfamily)